MRYLPNALSMILGRKSAIFRDDHFKSNTVCTKNLSTRFISNKRAQRELPIDFYSYVPNYGVCRPFMVNKKDEC